MLKRTVVAGVIALAACAGERTAAGGFDVDAAPELTLTEDLRIGSADDPAAGFAAVRGVDVDRDGNIYVGESREREIRVYDARGQFLRRIGQRGSGPGEFEGLPAFGVAGDTVWTYEGGRRRITLFARNGNVIQTGLVEPVRVPMPPPEGGIGSVTPFRLRRDGTFVSDMPGITWTMNDPPSGLSEGDTARVPRVRFAADGRVIDTIGWDLRPPRPSSTVERITFNNQRYYVPEPPSIGGQSVPLIDGRIYIDAVVAATNREGRFHVTRVSLTGDTVSRTTFRYTPRAFPDALLDSLAWQSARLPGGSFRVVNGIPVRPVLGADTADAFKAVRAAMSFPAFQHPVQSFALDRGGELWLRREDADDGRQRWLVLDANDGLRGTVTLGADRIRATITDAVREHVAWAGGDAVIVVELDDLDIPWIVRYRLGAR